MGIHQSNLIDSGRRAYFSSYYPEYYYDSTTSWLKRKSLALVFGAIRQKDADYIKANRKVDNEFDEIDMQVARYKPESIQSLMQSTKFNRSELQTMYRGFKQECPSGTVSEETFKEIYGQFFPQGDSNAYAHLIFHAFDKTNSGSITFEEFVVGLSVLCRGTLEDKLKWAFELYDMNKDGMITREEMTKVVTSIYEMMGNNCVSNNDMADSISDHVDFVFRKMDLNGDGIISYDEFMEACLADETLPVSMAQLDTVL